LRFEAAAGPARGKIAATACLLTMRFLQGWVPLNDFLS
jgi:hypothetical protein